MIERLVWRALFGGRRRPRSVFPRLFRSPPPNPTETGRAGEQMVASWMKRELPASIYRSFHDLMLPAPDGMTQIDHVFVSRFGVFVVETKNMGGWIFGDPSHRRWTQVLPGGRKQQFQNPLRQNHRHVKAVEEAIQGRTLPVEAVRSVVAFVGAAELKTALPANVTVGKKDLARHIKSFTLPVLADGQVGEVCDLIESRRLAWSRSVRREHMETLRSRADPTAERKCPRCGREMVLRTARKGANAGTRFWGCSGFPKCRAVQEVSS